MDPGFCLALIEILVWRPALLMLLFVIVVGIRSLAWAEIWAFRASVCFPLIEIMVVGFRVFVWRSGIDDLGLLLCFALHFLVLLEFLFLGFGVVSLGGAWCSWGLCGFCFLMTCCIGCWLV